MPPEVITGVLLDGQPVAMPLEKIVWRPSAYAVIFNAAGQLLVLDNIKTHKYDLPGGGIEIWERLEEALQREVWEETGLEVDLKALVHVEDSFFVTPSGKHWHTLKVFYRAEVVGGHLRNAILEDEWSVNPHWINLTDCEPDHLGDGSNWRALQKALDK